MNSLSLNGNWVDFVIILVLFYFVLDSFRHNFFVLLIEFLSFFLSFLLGLRLYAYVSQFLIVNFALPSYMSKAIGFFIVVSLSEVVFVSLMFKLYKKIPLRIRNFKPLNVFRHFMGLLDGLLLVAFLILLSLSFPLSTLIKEDITKSKMGSSIYNETSLFENSLRDIFGGVIDEGINLLTVKPGSSKSIPIKVSESNLTIDNQSEKEILVLINQERKRVGIDELTLNEELAVVARKYATDMWNRGYFSHYSPEGDDVSDRLIKSNFEFQIVGENLALAPTILIAHTGLMNSHGHRENILGALFRQVGIGVVDNGMYGKLFVQIFTN